MASVVVADLEADPKAAIEVSKPAAQHASVVSSAVSDEEFAKLNEAVNGKEIGDLHYAFMFALDMTMYSLFIFNRTEWMEGPGMLIGHFYSWHTITDLVGYMLPRNRRYIFNFFRMMAAFQMIQTVIWFWWADVDGDNDGQSGLRLGFSLAVFFHAILVFLVYGPHDSQDLINFIKLAKATFHRGTFLQKTGIGAFMMGMGALLAGEFNYRTHKNYDLNKVDAELISFQAGNGLTVLIKLWALNHLFVGYPKRRVFSAFVVTVLFWVQWIWMWGMFTNATVPYVHLAGEVSFTQDFFIALLCYLQGKLK